MVKTAQIPVRPPVHQDRGISPVLHANIFLFQPPQYHMQVSLSCRFCTGRVLPPQTSPTSGLASSTASHHLSCIALTTLPSPTTTGKRLLTIEKSWCLISKESWDVCPNFAVRNSTHPLNKSCYETVFIVHTVLPRRDWPSKFTLLCKVLTGGSSTCRRMLPLVQRWAGRERWLVGPKWWIHIYFSKWPQLDKKGAKTKLWDFQMLLRHMKYRNTCICL